MDYISIKNLEVFSRQEGHPQENRIGQKYALDAKFYINTRTAGSFDDIELSVDYSKVCHFISEFMKGHNFKLIESAAERLAEDILLEFDKIARVELTVKKQWAAIGLPIEEVAVTIDRGWHTAFLCLGSNMGDKEAYLRTAIMQLKGNESIRVVKESKLYVTEPYGMTQQDKFLNGAIEVKTLLTAPELLTFGKNLEKIAGRVETEHWGPRPLDIDIIFFDNDIIDLPQLNVPHVDMQNRAFVLEPMSEIAPYKRHPILGKTILEMYQELQKK